MAVDAVYLLSEKRQIRQAIVWGVYELIHSEGSHELTAEIDSKYDAKPGEYLGFFDVDGHFRLFEIDVATSDERRGVTEITATDAAVAELAHRVVEEVRLTKRTAKEAVQAAIGGSGWTLGTVTAGSGTGDVSAYMEPRWSVLRDIATLYRVRIVPYFEIKNGEIAGKRVDVLKRENIFRGRIIEGGSGAKIFVERSGSPVTRMYGVGKATGTEDPPVCVTFADVEAPDKPKGQAYIEDTQAIAQYGEGREAVFSDGNIEDPNELLDRTREELKMRAQPSVRGTAEAAEMEHIPGREHQIARMYDMIWVRTARGEDLQATAIDVHRNYLRRGKTKIDIGEETDDPTAAKGLLGKVASLSRTSSSLKKSRSAGGNKAKENETLIRLTASNLQSYQEGTDERLTTAELTLYGDGTSAYAGLVARVEDAEGEVSRAALTLYGDGTSANAGLIAAVNDNEALIRATADELTSKIELKADRIDLNGYVTASEFSTLEADLAKVTSGTVQASHLYTQNLTATNTVRLAGHTCEWKSATFLTSSTTLTVNATGGTVTGVTLNKKTATIDYLGT